MLIFPVRHHSPAAAAQVARLIRQRRPKVVLVEGPSDATPLIPLLLDRATAPPVAVYAYLQGEQVRAAFWPFCAYSPEYAALREGQAAGARLGFCDIPAGVSLTRDREKAGSTGFGDFSTALAEAAGFETFDELWEAAFEQEGGRDEPTAFIELLKEFGDKARQLSGPDRDPLDSLRERYMAATARTAVAEGISPDDVLLVCGAAHAAPIAEALAADTIDAALPDSPEAALSLVPYSFPRLSEQSGYGAGNLAPWFYQQVWERNGDWAAAARRGLAALAGRLREQGMVASLAQTIDAYNLAMVLAQMRTKPFPGVAEVAEAAVACFGQGHAAPVEAALKLVLVGDAVGRVTQKMGRTPLQAEFYATADRLGLPIIDAPKQVLLHMPMEREAAQSVFLHRLAVADIPYGTQMESGLGVAGRAVSANPLDHLRRVREKWQVQWSPATDAQLVERTAWGSTLADVCGRVLNGKLQKAGRIDEGTEVLLQMALCDLTAAFPQGLERCESLAADSGSFPALARATFHVDGLLTFGAARRLPAEELAALAARLFARAVLALPSGAVCSDDGAREVSETLTSLFDLVRRGSPAAGDADSFWEAIAALAGMEAAHAGLRGLALVLLELDSRMAPGELAHRLRYQLSSAADAADNARLVSGLFSLHRGTLVRNRGLISAVSDFLLELELEQLIPLLPVLRRSLGNLSPAERAYLSETLEATLGLSPGEGALALKVTDVQQELLRESDAAVAAILRDWRDRYGIG